jgi:hypothetical protein
LPVHSSIGWWPMDADLSCSGGEIPQHWRVQRPVPRAKVPRLSELWCSTLSTLPTPEV